MAYKTEIGQDILLAKELLDKEEIVAIPTETVYGLAANAFSEIAVSKVYKAKNRPANNPLIVHIGNKDGIHNLVDELNDKAVLLIEQFMPGPITILLPKNKSVPDIVTAGLPTVAIRMPAHPVAAALLTQLDYPLAAPSANPFGYISPTTAQHVYEQMNTRIPYILDGGQCNAGIESTIIGFKEGIPVIYRLGSLAVSDIEGIVGKVHINTNAHQVVAPGMLKKHYSPATPLLLTDDIDNAINKHTGKNIGLLTYDQYSHLLHPDRQIIVGQSTDMREIARNLYVAMHKMDAARYELIIARKLPDEGLGRSINDRLTRAATTTL